MQLCRAALNMILRLLEFHFLLYHLTVSSCAMLLLYGHVLPPLLSELYGEGDHMQTPITRDIVCVHED